MTHHDATFDFLQFRAITIPFLGWLVNSWIKDRRRVRQLYKGQTFYSTVWMWTYSCKCIWGFPAAWEQNTALNMIWSSCKLIHACKELHTCFTWRSSTNAFKRMDWNYDSLQRPRDSLWLCVAYNEWFTSVQFSIIKTCPQLDDADQIIVAQSCAFSHQGLHWPLADPLSIRKLLGGFVRCRPVTHTAARKRLLAS